MASSLSILPEELISSVVSHVGSAADLFNIALATKQLNRIATAYLYHRIVLDVDEYHGPATYHYNYIGPEVDEDSSASRSNYERLHSLVISLLGHPEHAAQVQHLHIRGQWPDPPKWNFGNVKYIETPPLLSRIKALKGFPRMWSADTKGWDTVQALIIILFHLVTNLRTLTTSLPEQTGHHWLWFYRKWSTDCLDNLQQVAFVESEGDGSGLARDSFLESKQLKSIFSYNSTDLEKNQLVDPTRLDDRGYMNNAMTLMSDGTRTKRHSGNREHAAEHVEILETSRDFISLSDYIQSFAALRTFAFDFRRESVPEHSCFYNAVILSLSTHAETLTALHLGGAYSAFHNFTPPINFSGLTNLKHLRTTVLFFLGFPLCSNGTSLPDHLMRERFPHSLEKLVLLVYDNEQSQIISELQHYFATDPPIIPNLQHLDIHCHAPEAMYAWLHDPVQQHHINLRIFRKLKVTQEDLSITPFVNTVEGFQQEITQVPIKITPPVSNIEDLMPVEEYEPDAEVINLIFEEAIEHNKSH
ncbi:hypothetical protein SLS60_006419 [Paraconiothyrium brasiliense]|uniref:F-box domain-containing protein n=1 Tax=Paraconiothyrium brasiliense TaxID=300254 RepID=A0ABR3RAN6_9PLEO